MGLGIGEADDLHRQVDQVGPHARGLAPDRLGELALFQQLAQATLERAGAAQHQADRYLDTRVDVADLALQVDHGIEVAVGRR